MRQAYRSPLSCSARSVKMVHRTLMFLAATWLLAMSVELAGAQDIYGRISGTVIDQSGAAVINAKVTITNQDTRLSRTAKTDDRGFYVAPELAAGLYAVTVEVKGFKTLTKDGNDLPAGGRVTVDLTLQIGDISEKVEVTTTGETVNTISGEISRTIDSQQVQHLALNERNYAQLVSFIPGAVLTAFDQTALTTGMSTTGTSVNGMRADGNLFTVDGGFNLDSGSNATQLDNVGIDFIREISVQSSNFSAEYGRNDGASVNVVTKSGGDKFHGTLFEYVRNDIFNAANAGAKLNAAPGTPSNLIKGPYRFNDFGWSLGGPIKRGKLFFFAGEEWKVIRLSAAPQNLTLPTTAELTGNFSAVSKVLTLPANAPAGCTITANVMSPQCITPNGQAIANVYALMQKQASSFTNLDKSANATFQPYDPQNWREDIIRVDYQIKDNQSMYFRYLHDNLNLIDAFGTFAPGGTLPTSPTNRIRPGYGYQGGYVWTISPHLLNEAKLNVSWNKQRIPPTGTNWQDATYGFNIPLPFANAGRFPNGIPHVTFSGIAGNFPTAAPSQFTGPFFSLLAPTTDISPSDNLVWQTGRHTLKFGVLYARNRKDQNSRPNSPNGAINFATGGNPNTTGDPFADALLGNFSSFSQQSADPIGHFRFNDSEAYVSDSWKITRKLNLELGLRFQHIGPTYTQGNNMVNFDPSQFKGCTTAVSANNVPTSTCLDQGFNIDGLVRPGAVPSDQLGRVPNGNSAFVTAVPATGERGLFKAENLFAPRLGFSWSPFSGDKTVLRGGFGMFYDKPEGNVWFGQPGVVPFLQAASFSNSNLSNPSAGTAGAATIFGLSAVDPNFVVARTMQYSLSIQHELPYGVLLESAYVGNLARHLVRQPNINVPTFAVADAVPANTRTNTIRPFLGYTDITQFRSDGNSNYNALQLSASKRKGNLVATVSYTYAKALGQVSGINDNPEPECPFTCLLGNGQTVSWRQFYYGPLGFDRRQAFVATYTYSLPFFKSQRGVTGQTLGGWEFSGVTRAQSGQPLTVSGTSSVGIGGTGFFRRASVGPGALNDLSAPACQGRVCWFNPLAFISPSATSAGNAPVGNITGPGYYNWDMSLRKNFRLPKEGTNLMLQADAFNVFNRTNWQNPGTGIGSGLGIITGSNPARQLQFGARFGF
ncbi:MAG TPA: carboxypeptidase regulatory-like domain-containing protein [Verrucomicrobiae bacterium]|jgi:hypothetical protein|nr:carboxypeptidase regulatory-like domain-containing protein [Verrucomicrobiae bacterium]